MKKVSVIIPSYNKAEYTRRTVESVLGQTYSNIEIIVVDDGSKDETDSVMALYKDKIKYIKKPNGGACSARNEGIRHSTGEFVGFLDCDDLYCPDKVQRCIDYLEQNPQMGFVYTGAYFIDEKDGITGKYDHERSREGQIAKELILGNFICNSTVIVRKQILDIVGFFDQNVFTPGDWDMWLRMAKVSSAGYISDPLTQYRVTDNYIFNRLELAQKEEKYVLDKFFADFPKNDPVKGKAYSNFYIRFAQCAFLKKQMHQFWTECREALSQYPMNVKAYGMMLAAVFAPGLLNEELTKRILRRAL